jgi:regulator of sigma E protease
VSDILLFIVVLGTLLIGHEFGHFIVARLSGVKVEEFGIGYPPRLATLFEAGGTKFTLNWIPFGGFVLPAGENDPDVPGGLASASKRVRTAVFLAGSAANIILAFLAFLMAYKFASPDMDRVLITQVVDGTPAQQAGIQPGDLVLSVDGQEIAGIRTVQEAIFPRIGTLISIDLERDGQRIDVELTPRVQYPNDQGPIGVVLGNPAKSTTWLEATKLGIDSIRLQFSALIHLPGQLLSGSAASEETRISGLKGIHDMLAWASSIDRSSQRPFLTLNLIGIISTGLAIANLLPLPPLDGGRLMFVAYEAIFKKRIAPRYEGFALAIGFSLLLVLMIYINFQDFINPITMP